MQAGPSGLTERAARHPALLWTSVTAGVAFVALTAAFVLHQSGNPPLNGEAPTWTRLGEIAGWRVLPLVTLVLALALAATGRTASARFVLATVIGAGLLMYGVKVVLRAAGAVGDAPRLSDFPSGHTTAATALVGSMVALVWLGSRHPASRAAATAAGAIAIVAISWARVASHTHTVLEAAGGVALGVFWLALCLGFVPPDQMSTSSLARSLRGLLVLGAGGFVLLALEYSREPSSLDADLVRRVAGEMPAWGVSTGRLLGEVGTWSAWVVGVGLPIALLAARRFRDAAWAAVTLGGIHIVTALFKDTFDRPRPHGVSAIALPGSPSFPSGHASGAVVTFGVLAALAAERWPARRGLFWALAAVLALSVGASRIVLGVHYVTDVLAGWCLGLAWLAAALLVRDAQRTRLAASGA